ncbi:hypothetical protein SCOCK_20263 [Actinacidiphila cocklensis]|uniref:Uncharacterized protein n=1 Tax=Actinacidiphila cocklensis TaxID=887465 RepID=A0A9W4DTI2_9ACTN|nr:hypothetical protein SCOCK_20263 [Actinacidiphila cocklensis]
MATKGRPAARGASRGAEGRAAKSLSTRRGPSVDGPLRVEGVRYRDYCSPAAGGGTDAARCTGAGPFSSAPSATGAPSAATAAGSVTVAAGVPPVITMPSRSKARLIRQRSSRATAAACPGIVLACTWSTTKSEPTDSRPSICTGSHRYSSQGSSLLIASAVSTTTARARSMSSPEPTWTSTTAVAQPWLRLPIRLTSPLRTYQISPFSPRSFVTRRPTSTTVPDATPASMTSPTPYWSSRIMKTPDRKSVTRLRAPKPIATPATPALASSGARSIFSTDRTVSAAVPRMRNDATLLSTEPIASLRCLRRSALTSSPPSAVAAAASAPRFIRSISRLIVRRTTERSTIAITRISRICSPAFSQSAQLSSTQLPAWEAVWETLSRGAAAGGVAVDTGGNLRSVRSLHSNEGPMLFRCPVRGAERRQAGEKREGAPGGGAAVWPKTLSVRYPGMVARRPAFRRD